MITSPAFGALTAELRRAEANHHDIDVLLPRLVQTRGFTDADDIAAVLHYRVAKATGWPASAGRARRRSRLIAGLVPEATGTMTSAFGQALTDCADLIEARAAALLDTALIESQSWTTALGVQPKQTRRRAARAITAYRDRYNITDNSPLGAPVESDAQKVDAARARIALDRAWNLANAERQQHEAARRTATERVGPRL